MIEIWKDIEGYEGLYQVSNLGRVQSVDRIISHDNGRGQRIIKGKLLKQILWGAGYYHVSLSKNGIVIIKNVHILVANAFCDNPYNKPYVDHIDGDKTNNIYTNLRFVTPKENSRNPSTIDNMHSWKNGNVPWNKGKDFEQIRGYNHPRHKEIIQLSLNDEELRKWASASEVQRELGYNQSAISAVCRGKSKTAYGYKWKFKEVA